MKLKLLALSLLLSGSLSAAELYDPSKNYSAGAQVSLNGNVYEAQWWANPGQSPADITGNAWESPWILVSEGDSGETAQQETVLEYFERSHTLNAADMGLDSITISAIERYQDRLYVTHDTTPGVVLVVDATTGRTIDRIEGIPHGSGISTYRRINELHIDGNLLYVASLSSNRVDVFDLDDNHRHITSLGNGAYYGANALVHAQSVVTTNEYVIASDASDVIKVYRQQDVAPENHYRIPHYGYLQFEGKYTNRKVQMHTLGDYLLVSTENRNYFVYDLRKLESAVASGTRLAAEKRVDVKIQKIDKVGEQLVVNLNGRLEWHNISDVIANDFTFTQPTRVITSLDGASVGNLKDVHFTHTELVTASANQVHFDTLRESSVTFTPNAQVDTTKLVFDDLAPFSVGEILSMDEPHHIITNPSLRSVKINSPVKTEFIDTETVQITSYAAVELTDLKIEVKLDGTDHWLLLANLDRIPAYAQFTLPLSAFGTGQFNTSDGSGTVDLENVFNSTLNYTSQFDYRFDSYSDTFAQTLASLKPSWRMQFANEKDGKWREVNGLYAREWLIILTNLAYMVSQEEFEYLWFNFEEVMGYRMNGTAGPVDGPGGFFTPEDTLYWYNALLNREYVNGGVTQNGGGLGAAWITGFDTWMFYTHYYGTWGIIAHEFGHGFDGKGTYHHHTSFANSGSGWHPLITQLANYHIRKGDLPYMDDSINGFYKPENAPYHHNGVDQNKRKYRSDNHLYAIESFFLHRADMEKGWQSNGEHMNLNTVAQMSNLERTQVAKYAMGSESPFMCRFTFEDGEQYYGYVAQQGDNARCEAGSEIYYRRADGTKVALQSAWNAFDWLSRYNPEQANEAVYHQNGQPLCTVNRNGFYGVGFVSSNGKCTQLPNVYWSNNRHWTFSTGWNALNYADNLWTPLSTRTFSLGSTVDEQGHENCGSEH